MNAADLFDPATPIACSCGDLMQVRWVVRDGANGGDPVTDDRGRAGIDRECPTCQCSLTVEVSR